MTPILVIIDKLKKIVYYKVVKVIIDVLKFAKIIINIVVQNHNLSNSIILH